MREYDLINAHRRTSSHNDGEGGHCAEVADGVPGVVRVRDSKTPDGPVLLSCPIAWHTFVRTARQSR